ncbi:hypothetical protein PAGU2595_013040 [Lysobacter xanthus]
MKWMVRTATALVLFALALPALADPIYVTRTTTCTAYSCVRTTIVWKINGLGQQEILSTETVTYANPTTQAK